MKKIEFFDCSQELDMQKAERILKGREVISREIVQFPYLMLIWDEVQVTPPQSPKVTPPQSPNNSV